MNKTFANKGSGPDVLVALSDTKTSFFLEYLFSIICKMPTAIATSHERAVRFLGHNQELKFMVVGSTTEADKPEALIKKASKMEKPPFILVIDAENNTENRIAAYEAGADDVLRTPFSMLELHLRLRARGGARLTPAENIGYAQMWEWNTEAFMVQRAGLTRTEAQIVHVLMEHRGQALSRNDISIATSGHPWIFGSRNLDVHISHIRKKLDKALGSRCTLTTVHSAGYVLDVDDREFSTHIS